MYMLDCHDFQKLAWTQTAWSSSVLGVLSHLQVGFQVHGLLRIKISLICFNFYARLNMTPLPEVSEATTCQDFMDLYGSHLLIPTGSSVLASNSLPEKGGRTPCEKRSFQSLWRKQLLDQFSKSLYWQRMMKPIILEIQGWNLEGLSLE